MSDNNKKSVHWALKVFFGLTFIFFSLALIALPLTLVSVLRDINNPPSERAFELTPKVEPKPDHTTLHLHVIKIDEVKGEATLSVHGYRTCGSTCKDVSERVLFFSAGRSTDILHEAIPVYDDIILTENLQETYTEINVAVDGQLSHYPFDRYHLGIGFVLEQTPKGGEAKILTPEETKGRLFITIEEEVPRIDFSNFEKLDPKTTTPRAAGFQYAYATYVNLQRPLYLKLLVLLVISLSLAVTAFTMTTRPFIELLVSTSGLIFGIWGVRGLLLSGFSVGITLLDTIFQSMVVFILAAVAFRGMNYFHRVADLRILPWARSALTRECPECKSHISPSARKCPNCGSSIPPILR